MITSIQLDPLQRRLTVAAFAIGALAIMSARAHAADPEQIDEVTISAPRTQTVGRDDATGAPIEQTSVTERIKVDPVTLTTNSGVTLLEDKVREAAREACDSADPFTPDDGSCVADAVKSAQAQVDALVAQAKSNANS